MNTAQQVDRLIALGFDLTYSRGRILFPRCSQCQFLAINGAATHETGCPNAMHECHGCNAIVPVRQKYCEECAR